MEAGPDAGIGDLAVMWLQRCVTPGAVGLVTPVPVPRLHPRHDGDRVGAPVDEIVRLAPGGSQHVLSGLVARLELIFGV